MPSPRHLLAATALLFTAVLPRPVAATPYSWDGGLSQGGSADANWSTGANWAGGLAPSQSASDNDLFFLGTASRTTSNNNFMFPATGASGALARTLTFSAGSTAYTLTGNPFYIGTGGIVQNSSAAQTFNAAVAVAATETWTFGAGAGGLVFAGGLNVVSGGALTVNTSNLSFTGTQGVQIGTYNFFTNSASAASSLTLTGGATFAPASLQIGNNASATFSQDSGTLNTGAITLGNTSNGTFRLSGTGQVNATSLSVGSSTGTNLFQQDGGSVNLGTGAINIANTGVGTYTLNSGTVSAGSLNVGGLALGTFNQNGGMVTLSGALGVGGGGRGPAGSVYNLAGGQLNVGSMVLGSLAVGAFVQTGGTVVSTGTIALGTGSGSAGSYNLSGAASTLTTAGLNIGNTGNGTFTMGGGTLNVTAGGTLNVGTSTNNITGTFTQNGGAVTVAGSGGVLIGSTTLSSGTYSLNGGTLTTSRVTVSNTGTTAGSPVSTFNFNGGTLQANSSNTVFVAGLTRAYVQAGGAKIDSNGQSVLIPQALLHDPALASGVLDGGMLKLGSGSLALSGANTYNGGTVVAGGTLEAAGNGAFGTGNVTLAASGLLLRLDAGVTNAIADSAALSLNSTVGGKLLLSGTAGQLQETVGTLDFNGVRQPYGSYGASGSGAFYIDDTHFSGTGILFVAVPEPGSVVFAGAGVLALTAMVLRRRRA